MSRRIKTWLIIILILIAALEVGSILFSDYLSRLEEGNLSREDAKKMIEERGFKPKKKARAETRLMYIQLCCQEI